jgi:L-iditol 2-dehydrogenase
VVDVSEQDLQAVVRDATEGRGADVVFECSGAPSSIGSCLEVVRPLGAYTQVGICGREVTVDFDAILFKQLRVRGSVAYSVRTWERLLRILGQGKIRLADLVTHTLPLERWEEAFELCEKKRGIKVLISPGPQSP